MATSTDCRRRTAAERPAPAQRFRARVVAGALLCLALFSTSVLGAAESEPRSTPRPEMPWLPTVIQALDPYVPDPSLFGGRLALDHFASGNSADFAGWISAPLSNGDIVTVGLVSAWGSGNSSSGLRNLGLVHYNAVGQRVAWTNAGSYGFNGNEYLVYPNVDPPQYQYLRDVKVANGWIYILVDVQQQAQSGLGRQDVRVVQVREDGSSFTSWPTFGYSFDAQLDDADFYGAQMVLMSPTMMIVAATGYDIFAGYVAVTRLLIQSNGVVTEDPEFGYPYGGDTSLDYVRFYGAPADYCAAGNHCTLTASFAMKPVGVDSDDFYVAGSRRWDGDDWDPYAVKISSITGHTKPEFTPDGFSSAPFDQPNSSFADYAQGLYVYQDEVYIGVQVDRGCHPGIGVAKLNGATGDYITSFGDGGQIVFGGRTRDDPDCFNPPDDDIPLSLSATGGRLGIAGYSHWTDQGDAEHFDPMLAVVDAATGSVMSFRSYPALRADGSRLGDAILGSIFGGPSPTSPFTVGGQGRDASAGNTLSFMTGRFIPASADRIFASNFGQGDDRP